MSTIIAISLGWMLFNIWLTLVMLQLNKSFISGWDDYAWILLCSVVSPITIYFAGILHHKLEIATEKGERNEHHN